MSQPSFALGVRDARAGRGYHSKYERWDGDKQWSYERGRHWALLVPRSVQLRRNDGKLSTEAVRWFEKFSDDIL